MAKQKKGSLFQNAKYKMYGKMVSFKDLNSARESVKKLKSEFNNAKTKTKKLRIAKVANYSANRAHASGKRKRLSQKEKKEYKEIGNIYRNLSDYLFFRYDKIK